MTHWDTYNLFERIIFLIGYFKIVYLLIKVTAWICDKWDRWQAKKRALQQKAQHSEAVDGTDWIYDCRANIKRVGHELRQMSWENVRKGGKGA
jgi:hypothetical protein